MNTQALKNFIRIAETKNITLAAKQIYISQPSLSNQLKALEKELGVTLVIRMSRHLELTDAGEALYRYAKRVVEAEQELMGTIRSEAHAMGGTLKVGLFPSADLFLPSPAIKDFTDRYPQIQLELHEGETNILLTLLESKVVDLALVRLPVAHSEGIETVGEPVEESVIAVSSAPLDPPRDSFAALCREPLLLTRRMEIVLGNEAVRLGHKLQVRLSATNVRTVLSLASLEVGTAIVPKIYQKYAKEQGLFCKDLEDLSHIRLRTGILKRKSEPLSPLGAEWIEAMELAMEGAREPLKELQINPRADR